MDQNKVNEMAAAIVAANAHTPEEIIAALAEYWDGKMAVVWERADVLGKAWARGMLLTNEQADDLLDDMRRHHDAELGITWTTIKCALDEVEPPDIESLDLAKLADYPGEFRVWFTEGGVDVFKAFDTDEGRNLAHALAFAAEKAAEVDGEVQVCVIDGGDNEYPAAYYEVVNGELIIENASDRNREVCSHGFAESCPENCN